MKGRRCGVGLGAFFGGEKSSVIKKNPVAKVHRGKRLTRRKNIKKADYHLSRNFVLGEGKRGTAFRGGGVVVGTFIRWNGTIKGG